MSDDMNAMRMFNLMRKMNQKKNIDNMIIGTVNKIDPLEVDAGNGLILSSEFLFLGQMCRPHKVTIPHNHQINAFESEITKSINTKSISEGVATDVPQKTGSYDVKTQEIKRNDEKGIDERTLKTETKSGIDLGGASLAMNVNVAGSVVAGATPAGTSPVLVSTTVDLSTFTVNDSGHKHIIPEHSTQDVHFPKTEYEKSVTIEIYPRLKVGDKVLMFAMNNYNMYYIAERIEEGQ